ncbi:MAG TPA: aminotransferase class III-fold pyridoxal phosphate-dependent enzyme, partial [Burkholderiales bacterium]|nr:aminotransferase class III-fold pyridoxal phosphate-dependent enzyme [Burkholderiales bacterium]
CEGRKSSRRGFANSQGWTRFSSAIPGRRRTKPIKLARLYGHGKGIDIPTIIVMEKSFHGRTMATLSATGNRKVQAGFEPLLSGFARVPYDDIPAVEQVASHNKNIVAILVEPYQGEGGIQVPQASYLMELRRICDQHGWLLMLDEVQCGTARSGKWFAFQHGSAVPDVMTLAKGLGSGVPVGACLARGPAAEVFKAGNHGSTFGGNPLACAAALATLSIIEEENLLDHASSLGQWIRQRFSEKLSGLKGVREIRGQGLLIGIELEKPCTELPMKALEKGLLINVTAENVVRLLPALVMKENEAEQMVDEVSALIIGFLEGN